MKCTPKRKRKRRLTTRRPVLLLLPCSLRLSDQFLLVVGGAVDVGLGSFGLERSEVVPAIEDTREERSVPDNLQSRTPPRTWTWISIGSKRTTPGTGDGHGTTHVDC